MMALDKKTGKTVWKSEEPGLNHNLFGTWATPLVVQSKGRDELIMPLPGEKVGSPGWLKAYDPLTGKKLWQCEGLGNEIYAMPIIGKSTDLVIGISGHKGPTMAVRTGGSGNVTDTHQAWQNTKNPQRVGSGVIQDGHLYLSDASGEVECLDLKTGEVIWKEKLSGKLWGSMLIADGKLFATTLEGDTFVMDASPKFKLLATNKTGETTYAALAVSGGELFLRTHKNLYCISNNQE